MNYSTLVTSETIRLRSEEKYSSMSNPITYVEYVCNFSLNNLEPYDKNKRLRRKSKKNQKKIAAAVYYCNNNIFFFFYRLSLKIVT